MFFSIEPRQRVVQLRELDLQLAVAARRVLREDVEDQHRAIEDLELGRLADRARLAGREIGIEDHDLGAELHRAQQDLVELAAADEELRIGLGPALDEHVEHLDAGGAAQLAQLGDARLGIAARGRAATCTSSARSLPRSVARDAVRAAELLPRARAISSTKFVRGAVAGSAGSSTRAAPSGTMCADEQLARAAGGVDGDRGDRVEPQQREVGEVVARERLAAQVRVDEPQAAEAARAAAHAAEVGQDDLRRVADDHVLDRAAAIDQHADLAVQLRRLRRELRGELGATRSRSARRAGDTGAPAP